MKTLYLRIYLTVVAVLLVFALVSGWVFQHNIERARDEARAAFSVRLGAWAELAQSHLPPPGAPLHEQRLALLALAERMHLPLALDSATGERIAATESFVRHQGGAHEGPGANRRLASLPLADGRSLWVLRPPPLHSGELSRQPHPPQHSGGPSAKFGPVPREDFGLPMPPGALDWFGVPGVGLVVTLAVLFVAISIGAYPVVRRLTRRLESLKQGVEAFGAGALSSRVAEDGNDEVAAVGASFNHAAARVEALVRSHQSLLANASHELRSPLARLKMALALLDETPPGAPAAQRERLRHEIAADIKELDTLIDEVLLASRLEARPLATPGERVDLLALAAEEAARLDAAIDGVALFTLGDERLLRRALRNLIENARRYGGGEVSVSLLARDGQALLQVCDRGAGVPEAARERIFEPFYRLPGHADRAGGVGLGLSLVKQIAERHGGSVCCKARDGGGCCFELRLPSA